MKLPRCKLHALVLGCLFGAALSAAAQAADKINFMTDFGFNGRHAYFFVALEKGYYKDAGLDVKFVRGQGSVDAIRQVGAGNATFGFADAGSLVLARANDQIPVKLVAIVYAQAAAGDLLPSRHGPEVGEGSGGRIDCQSGGRLDSATCSRSSPRPPGIDAGKVHWVVASSVVAAGAARERQSALRRPVHRRRAR